MPDAILPVAEDVVAHCLGQDSVLVTWSAPQRGLGTFLQYSFRLWRRRQQSPDFSLVRHPQAVPALKPVVCCLFVQHTPGRCFAALPLTAPGWTEQKVHDSRRRLLSPSPLMHLFLSLTPSN